MPSRLLMLGKGAGRYGFLGLGGLIKFFMRHWYIFITLLIILPSIVASFRQASLANNPLLPFLQLGLKILSADVFLNELVNMLRESPELVIGMAKPLSGIWQNVVYYWSYFFNVGWAILTNVWLIFVPLVFIHRLVKIRNISEESRNWTISVITFMVYLILVNAIFVIYALASGNITIDVEGMDQFVAYLMIAYQIIPLHGLFNLMTYFFQQLGLTQMILSLLKNFQAN